MNMHPANSTIHARSRAPLPALALAAVFAIGLLSGLVASLPSRSASQPAAVSAGALSQGAAEAHLAWLRSEHDSYGSATTDPALAQAHLLWLRSEHETYGSPTTDPASKGEGAR